MSVPNKRRYELPNHSEIVLISFHSSQTME